MKKRTAVIGALVSLLPMGQPLVIGTGAALTSAAVMLSVPQRVKAESAVFYYNRGVDKYDAGDYYGAISDYSKAIEINPRHASAYYNRGTIKGKELGDYYGAIADYNKSIEINPMDADAYRNRGLSKEYIRDLKGACSDWRKASELGDKDPAKWVKDQC